MSIGGRDGSYQSKRWEKERFRIMEGNPMDSQGGGRKGCLRGFMIMPWGVKKRGNDGAVSAGCQRGRSEMWGETPPGCKERVPGNRGNKLILILGASGERTYNL